MSYKNFILKSIRFIPFALMLNTNSFFLTCVTADTLYTSIDYIVRGCVLVNDHRLINKYIYFGLVLLFYLASQFILWMKFSNHLYFLLTTPYIMDFLLRQGVMDIIIKIKIKIIRIFKRVLCDQLTRIFNYIISKILHLNFIFYHQDLGLLIENTNQKDIENFIKSFIKIVIVHIVESNYAIAHYIARIYSGGILSDIGIRPLESKNDAVKILLPILYTRNWNKLSDPFILRLFFQLYDSKNINIKVLFMSVMEIIMKFTCCISIGSLIESQLVVTIISLFFFHRKVKDKFSYVRLIGLVIGYFTNIYWLNAFCCEFGDILVLDKVFISIIKMIYIEVIPYNFNFLFIVFPPILFFTEKIIGPFVLLILISINREKIIIRRFFLIYMLAWISSFSFIHIFFISLAIGLLEKEDTKPDVFIENLVVIKDYVK